jgi:tripartite ATP-independent transporter DctM subunit
MSPITIAVIGLLVFIVLMLLGLSIPFAMLLVGFVGCCVLRNPVAASQILVGELFENFSSYALTVGAMFGLMGFMANYSGVGSKLFTAVNSYMGHWKGGLAMATQVACAGFGAICGSVPATIGTMSAIAYPEMKKRGYTPGLAGASISAGAQISTIIPPSSLFIIYCMATNVSVGRLFMGGIVPGILLCVANCVAIFIYVSIKPKIAPRADRASWKERWHHTRQGGLIEIAIVFIVSIGGMFAGFFTPTEAGAVGAVGMLIITVVTRQMNFKKYIESCIAGVELLTMVLLLLGCAAVFSRFISLSTLPTVIGNFCNKLLAVGTPKTVLMLAIILIYFILGMVVDLISVSLMTIPIFFPIVTTSLGYDPVWFGVIIALVICLGGITPPFGASVFMIKSCSRDPELTIGKAFSASVPFIISMLLIIVLLVFTPNIVTALPNLMYGVS